MKPVKEVQKEVQSLPSAHQLNDEVVMRGKITEIAFTESKVLYGVQIGDKAYLMQSEDITKA